MFGRQRVSSQAVGESKVLESFFEELAQEVWGEKLDES